MHDQKNESLRQAAVHWFRYRFDIGYRARIEIKRHYREQLVAVTECLAEEARHNNGAGDLFDEVCGQLRGDL